jgi:hypothetical protein
VRVTALTPVPTPTPTASTAPALSTSQPTLSAQLQTLKIESAPRTMLLPPSILTGNVSCSVVPAHPKFPPGLDNTPVPVCVQHVERDSALYGGAAVGIARAVVDRRLV